MVQIWACDMCDKPIRIQPVHAVTIKVGEPDEVNHADEKWERYEHVCSDCITYVRQYIKTLKQRVQMSDTVPPYTYQKVVDNPQA